MDLASHFPQHLAELLKIQPAVPVLISKYNHLGNLSIRDLFSQTGEHMLEFLKANRVQLAVPQEIVENALALLDGILDPLILSLQKLYELILFELTASVSIDLVHQVLGLLLVDLHLAGLEHLHYLVLGDAA